MEDKSILNNIKKLLGMPLEFTPFDDDIIIHINSVFSELTQIGVGPHNSFQIEDSSETWNDYSEDSAVISMVKPFVYLKVRLLFDPPTNASHLDSINNQIKELEYRMYTWKGGY